MLKKGYIRIELSQKIKRKKKIKINNESFSALTNARLSLSSCAL